MTVDSPAGIGIKRGIRPRCRRQQVLTTGLSGLALLLCAETTFAQNLVRWTTNYYTVTGANPREIRRSINQSKPWRGRHEADAVTSWKVDWKFNVVSTGQGCRPGAVGTVTTITTTLPRYVPPTNAPPELLERWAKYFPALARHEARHAAFGTSAASEVQARLAAFPTVADCASLRREVDTAANGILERYRREEREFDQRTNHGATEGARFP